MSPDDENLYMERYLNAMAEHARSELERSSALIERFTKIAAAKGIALVPASFSYIQTIGIVAFAPKLAKNLLGISKVERDGLYAYNDIAVKLPPSVVLQS